MLIGTIITSQSGSGRNVDEDVTPPSDVGDTINLF